MKKFIYFLLLYLNNPLFTVGQSNRLAYASDASVMNKSNVQLNDSLEVVLPDLGTSEKSIMSDSNNLKHNNNDYLEIGRQFIQTIPNKIANQLSLPSFSLWEGTVTGLPPLQGNVTVPSKVRITISGSNVSGYVNNGPYPNGAYGSGPFSGTITSGSINHNTLTFDCWGESTLPWTMTETTLTGFYGAQPGSGNVGPIPQFEYKLTRVPDPTVAHFHQLSDNPVFSDRRLLTQIPIGTRTNAFSVCADGSQASVFIFTGGDFDYSAAVVKIYDDFNNEPDKYGSFTVLNQTAKSIEVRYKHPLYLPTNNAFLDLNLVIIIPSNGYIYNTIRVVNAPVVLVHGFASNSLGFQKMKSVLINSGYWPSEFIYLPDYRTTSLKHFSVNSLVVPNSITTVILQAISRGCAAGKASVIGHSMGGILTRLYLQEDTYLGGSLKYRDDIYKIITLNTPHSGTQFANVSSDLSFNPLYFNNIRNLLLTTIKIWLDDGAVTDLAANSEAINRLNSPNYLNRYTAPSHSITTTLSYTGTAPVDIGPILLGYTEFALASLLNINLNEIYGEINHDFVVPMRSQLGGLVSPSSSTIVNQGHAGSMEHPLVISRALSLLLTPVTDAVFYKKGYSPPTLTYTKVFSLPKKQSQERSAMTAATVQISQPTRGKTVLGGSSLQLQASGNGLSSLWLFVSYAPNSDSIYTGFRTGNAANISMMTDKLAGRRSIVAIGKTADGQYVSDTSYFYVSNNYCQSVQSGNWSDLTTWSCGHEPTYIDDVEINSGHTITLNGTTYANRLIDGGKLVYSNNGRLRLAVTPPGSLSLSGNMNFGQVTIGQTSNRTLVIQNTGQPVMITGLSLPSGFSGAWSGMLTTGASQSVVITFTASTTGIFNGQLVINSNPVATGNTINIIATGTTSTLNNGLTMHLPFSGNASDASGNGNNGTVIGATLTTDRFNVANQAYSFVRSSGQYISISNNAGLDITGSALSICAWINPNWNGSYLNMQIVSKAQDGSSAGRKFGLGTGGPTLMNFELRTNNGTTDQDWNCANCTLQANTWQFVTVTYDGATMKWYKNGTLVYQVAKTGSIVSTTSDLVIGSFGTKNTSFFNGSMDEIRIYNRSLSDTEIQSLSQL